MGERDGEKSLSPPPPPAPASQGVVPAGVRLHVEEQEREIRQVEP